MPRPTDFFIAGSPKCGTTALFEYLTAHPSVFMPACKEPNYFCSDIEMGGVPSLSAYLALFSSAPPQALTGEASSMYLYSEVAIAGIMAHNAAAKIIVILRHPVEAAQALFGARRSHGHENAAGFAQAWALQRERLDRTGMPPRWHDPRTLQYGAIYRYAPQVRRLLDNVPPAQRLILIYEEFFAEPDQQFAKVLQFLNLPADPDRQAFPRINPTLQARSAWLQGLLARPPPWLAALSAPLRRAAHLAGLHPVRTLDRLNRFEGEKPPLPPQFREELERYFATDVAETEQLLARKLWPMESQRRAV